MRVMQLSTMPCYLQRWSGVIVLSFALLVPSCNSLPTSDKHPGECGIGLVIWMRQVKTAQYQYFTIDNGVFAYGAGVTALNLKTFWQTDLSVEQCQTLRRLTQEGGWLNASAAVQVAAVNDSVADVAITWDEGRQQFICAGDDASLKAVTSFLVKIADVRFDRELDRLPEAGLQSK